MSEELEIENEELWERWRCEVDKGQGKERIDKYLAEHMTNTSRNRIQTAAEAGNVWVNGLPVASNYRTVCLSLLIIASNREISSKSCWTTHPMTSPSPRRISP